MPRVQDAIPSLARRAWKGCSNPLLLTPLRFASESRPEPVVGIGSVREPPEARFSNQRRPYRLGRGRLLKGLLTTTLSKPRLFNCADLSLAVQGKGVRAHGCVLSAGSRERAYRPRVGGGYGRVRPPGQRPGVRLLWTMGFGREPAARLADGDFLFRHDRCRGRQELEGRD